MDSGAGRMDDARGLRRVAAGRSRGFRKAISPRGGLLSERDAASGARGAAEGGEAQPAELGSLAPARDPGAAAGGGLRGDDRSAGVSPEGRREADAAGGRQALPGSG